MAEFWKLATTLAVPNISENGVLHDHQGCQRGIWQHQIVITNCSIKLNNSEKPGCPVLSKSYDSVPYNGQRVGNFLPSFLMLKVFQFQSNLYFLYPKWLSEYLTPKLNFIFHFLGPKLGIKEKSS